MALTSGTATKYDMAGIRESLSDIIYRITPEDTVFMSSAGRGPAASNTLEEWQTDSLAAVDTDNAQLEGDNASYTTPSPTVRVGNYTQISRKTASVSDTSEEVTKAGRKGAMAFEIAKRSAELKRDQESIFLTNQAGNAGGVGTARRLASLGAWVKTNVSKGTGGGNPAYTSGVPSAARTDSTSGDLRALTETIFKNVIQQAWTSGGKPRTVLAGPVNKQRISGFAGIATRNFDLSNVDPRPTAIIAAADVYVSDFGPLRIVPSRFQRERDVWFLDWDYVDVSYLRPHKKVPLAKTGDAENQMIICEYTLRVLQEAALGLAADLTTT